MSGALRALGSALLAALVLLGCKKASPPPATAPGAVRIVALSPAIALIVADLRLADQIVGRHAFDLSLDPSIPVVGDQSGIDYENLARVGPTHILLDWGSRELPPRLTSLAADRGWTVRDYRMLSLDDIRATTLAIADDLESDAARSRALELAAAMDEAWAPSADFAARCGRCLILFGADSTGAAGPGSFHAELIEALGGRSAVDDGAPFVTLDTEDVRRLDPDSILIFAPGADPSRWRDLLGALAKADLRAIGAGRVAVIDHPHGLTPSTAMIEVARRVTNATGVWPAVEAPASGTLTP